MAQCTAPVPAAMVENERMRRMVTAAAKDGASSPGARARISHGALHTSTAQTAAEIQKYERASWRKTAVRSAPARAVSIGTNAKTMLLISTPFNVSTGPIATASESAR